MDATSEYALEAAGVSLAVEDRILLSGFDMRVPAGSKTLLTGPSGCGKSTLLKCFMGFTLPTEGQIRVLGQTMTTHNTWGLRRRMAYVSQEPELGSGSVRECLERPFHYRANTHLRENLSQAPAWFERFRLAKGLLDKEAGTLSGGEKQRIALITAILLQRPIFLLDEPTSALDPKAARVVLEWLQSSNEITALVVAHHHALFSFADQTIDLDGGDGEGVAP